MNGRVSNVRVSAAQIRAARGLLGWSVEELCAASGLRAADIRAIESEVPPANPLLAETAERVLTEAGVDFIDRNGGGVGVRLRRAGRPERGIRPENLNAANDD